MFNISLIHFYKQILTSALTTNAAMVVPALMVSTVIRVTACQGLPEFAVRLVCLCALAVKVSKS